MSTESRTEKSARNAMVAIVCQFASLIISFVSRTFFIKILGADYLGINGLFSNILSVLSLADLGFGTALVYSLYKPLSVGDQKQIAALMSFFRKIYICIALSVLMFGLSLLPVLRFIVNTEKNINHLEWYYILFVINSSASYLCVYKSSILEADQSSYIVKINRTVFLVITNAVNLALLIITHNYFVYLIVQIVGTIATNFSISLFVSKKYPLLKSEEKLDKETKRGIADNIKSLFIYKFGGIVLNNTDNILISIIVSTTMVGYYSNYSLLFGVVLTFSELLFGAFTASVGNLSVSSDMKAVQKVFLTMNFANFWVYGFCSICLFCLLDDFVSLWLGTEYVLGTVTVSIICLNVFMPGMLASVSCFRTATGMFRETKYVFLITAILNLLFSVILGKRWGLNGILIATACSRLLTNVWFEPTVLIKKYFKESPISFFIREIKYYIIVILGCVLIYVLKLFFFELSVISFIIEAVLCFALTNLLFFIIFRKNEEFVDLKNRVLMLLKKK